MGAERMPVAWGFMLTVNAVSCFGPPFAGWMNDMTGSYNLGFIVAGALNVAACFVLAIIPCAQRSRQTRKSIINVTIDQNNEIKEWTEDILPFTVGDPPASTYVNYLSRTKFRCPELSDSGPSLSDAPEETQI
ncbi:monocarboxylate transporter 14-like [Alosa alosa]|nr:monocarboxylate transporter 14-like [Alosa alosa]